jgi:drug/metabolite transporter (DMT)-like permease
MLATMFCFISLDAIMKHLLESLSIVEVTWGRFFFATIAAILLCGRRLPRLVHSRVPKVQGLRSVLLMTTTGLFNWALRTTPLATATTIMFMTPLLVTMLSIPLLGERVGPRRWSSLAVGFAGAMVIIRPWSQDLAGPASGGLFLLAAALFNANYQIATRHVRADDPMISLLFTATAGAIVTSFIVPWFWTTPGFGQWLLLMGSGVAGGLGHYCLIKAMTAAPASVVAPFSYSSLVWASLFGLAIWGDWPDLWTWAGAGLIIASGLYIFQRERVLHENR